MTLLDRFRTPTGHKHPDPSVRLAHVSDLPLAERELLAAIAREDDDARVRRAAVAKLMDPGVLGAVAREDADEAVRAQAIAMLRDLALEVFEGTAEAESLDAVDALSDARMLAQIAKTSGREIVALRALSRVSDPRSLGSIARHASSEAVRRGAFERVRERADGPEILAIALNSEFKDTAVAAVDLLVADRGDLEQIASRGRNKAAAKRARGLLRAADAPDSLDDELTFDEPPTRESVASAPPAIAPSAEPPADVARAEVESVADDAPEVVAERDEEQRIQLERLEERRRIRLSELVVDAEAAAAEPDLGSARHRLNVVRREWVPLVGAGDVDDAEGVLARFDAAESTVTRREAEIRDREARTRREALARLNQLAARLDGLAANPAASLKAVERALRDVRAALGAIPPLPSRQDFEDVTRRLKAAQGVLMPKLQELRETDEWQRWANAGVQEQLCVRMEALGAGTDPEAMAREVRVLQEEWRAAADVPRAQADALWRRFKAAHDEVWAKCEAYFAEQAQTRADNLARKTALCEQVEALADSTNWIQTADSIKRLQAEWKTIGPVSRGREKAIWDRFRSACDRFFTRRHEDLARRKGQWAENLASKDALCLKAEALAESTDWDVAAAEMKRLQAEWKTVGPVKKSRSEAVWQRFRGACDRFFLRYTHRHDLAREERGAACESVCAELEALTAIEGDAPPDDLAARVRTIRGRWQQEMASRGLDPVRAEQLARRFAQASSQVVARWPAAFAGSDLDPSANRRRMEALVRRVEELAASFGSATAPVAGELTPATRLAAMLKEALAANTIGGKVDDDSRARAAADEVRQAQSGWSRLGPVADDLRRPLEERFQRACRQVLSAKGARRSL